MANWYVWHAAAGSGTGADWTNAYTKLRLAMAAKAAGDTFYIAHDHAETEAAAMAIVSPGTDANLCRVYCVNRAGTVPPVSADLRTTATITTTGAFAITITGSIAECYGITFASGTGSTATNLNVGSTASRLCRFVNCTLSLPTTVTGSRINMGSGGSGSLIVLENTKVQFGHIGQKIYAFRIWWRNTPTAIAGATIPTVLFTVQGTSCLLEGVDLSALGSGRTIADTSGAVYQPGAFTLKDCKLGASVTVATAPFAIGIGTQEVVLIRCDSGDTNYRTEKYNFLGAQTTETTIVHTGGASDGTTTIAWKIVTSVNSRWEAPFECLPISFWNETTGSAITVTIQGIWGTGSVPINSDIWIDVEYLGTSGFSLASKATSTKADGLAAGTNIPAGSGTWGGSTTRFAMAATFTPQEKGPVTIYVRAAKVSSTFYIDPKPVVT